MSWDEKISAAHTAALSATAYEEQAIRDALADGTTVADIARALGTKNRQRIYAIMGRGPKGEAATVPALTPVVYLRGKGNSDVTWKRVEQAMWARGWSTTRDRTTAWHLARGGVPVVQCDFSADLDRTEGPYYGYDLYVVVGRVRAKYVEGLEAVSIRDLLPTSEVVRLTRGDALWLDELVVAKRSEPELVLTNGGDSSRPLRHDPDGDVLDEQALARLVAAALAL